MMLLKLSMLCAMLALSSAYPKEDIDEAGPPGVGPPGVDQYYAETEDMDNYLSEMEAESLIKAKMEAAMPEDPKMEDFVSKEDEENLLDESVFIESDFADENADENEESADTEQVSFLYPFGRNVGDRSLGATDDSMSPPITIPPFRFYGRSQTRIFVSNNGIMSFGSPQFGFTPIPLNRLTRPVIAPYWADVDARRGGQVLYRRTTSISLRRTAAFQISNLFPNQPRFFPTYLFINTLPGVRHFNAARATRSNTLQSVLATDGSRSYVMFLYRSITWTTGDASRGRNGLGGTEAAIGLAAGDRRRVVQLPQSFTPAVVNIETTGNSGVRGLYVFRVDGSTIQQPPVCSVV